ncbi:MAG TPA: alpha/beta hydrolase [Candidatus Thermoplasmatota archaeon]|nr:alpha/beta hydrolase [Candidatus Thermoplasmatota archaeon]
MRALVLLAALLLLAPGATHAAGAAELVSDYRVRVGEPDEARGLLGVPVGEPRGLVVILRGYNHSAESHRGHLQHLAEQGWVGVAMDYTGERDSFPLMAGALDTRDAILDVRATLGLEDKPAHLYSVSMGTAVAALLVPMLPDTFTYWVNNEGLSMLHETWAGAAALSFTRNPTAVRALAAIEEECGGSPAHAPDCYRARSAALRADELSGIAGVVLTHGLNDGLVPHNQGREMVSALRAAGIPSDFYTVVRSSPGGEGTTITGHAGLGGMGLAGHGTESNDAHTLTKLSFELLDQVLEGRLVPSDAERVFDDELGHRP